MGIDPRTPVLVGAGAVSQKNEDHATAREPIELMIEALERAADDAGNRDLLRRADTVRIPQGFAPYSDPARLVADRFGATAKTEIANIGILQTTLFGRSVRAIAAGHEDIVLIAGGEAKYRALRAQIAGQEPRYTEQNDVEPDETLHPHDEILSQAELAHGLAMPVNQYALIENALRYAEGQTIPEHVSAIAKMWAGMSQVAAGNPDAWTRRALRPDEIATATAENRMLAFPYTKRHNSQWNVDQAAGLILCATEVARSLGIPEDRWVFPRAVTESNHMVPLCERAQLHRAPGFRIAGARAFAIAGVRAEDVTHRELYSCFPAAVRVQIRELDIDPRQPVTVTGGMAFAGGPLNNFVLQAGVRLSRVLREAPGEVGLLTAVSGVLTKQGVSLWSTDPGEEACRYEDVSDAVSRDLERLPFVADYTGSVQTVSGTIVYEASGPRVAFICDTPEGSRTIASGSDEELTSAATGRELCGQTLDLAPGRVSLRSAPAPG